MCFVFKNNIYLLTRKLNKNLFGKATRQCDPDALKLRQKNVKVLTVNK